MWYRLLETVRQYAQEKLGDSGEAAEVRSRHRDYYTARAAELESHGHAADEQMLEWAQVEMDNLRAAYGWSLENSDLETALRLVSSLHQFWIVRGRFREGLAGFEAVLTDKRCAEVAPAIWVRAVADQGILAGWAAAPASEDRARDALETARKLEDPALITRALAARGMVAFDRAGISVPCLAEAVDLARATGDRWNLCQILSYRALTGAAAGEPILSQAAAEEGRDLADALGLGFFSRHCRAWLGMALMMRGDLAKADQILNLLVEEAEAAGDHAMRTFGSVGGAEVLASRGEAVAAQAAIESAWDAADAMGGYYADTLNAVSAPVALVAGSAARDRGAADAA
jgi:hypothetical protein